MSKSGSPPQEAPSSAGYQLTVQLTALSKSPLKDEEKVLAARHVLQQLYKFQEDESIAKSFVLGISPKPLPVLSDTGSGRLHHTHSIVVCLRAGYAPKGLIAAVCALQTNGPLPVSFPEAVRSFALSIEGVVFFGNVAPRVYTKRLLVHLDPATVQAQDYEALEGSRKGLSLDALLSERLLKTLPAVARVLYISHHYDDVRSTYLGAVVGVTVRAPLPKALPTLRIHDQPIRITHLPPNSMVGGLSLPDALKKAHDERAAFQRVAKANEAARAEPDLIRKAEELLAELNASKVNYESVVEDESPLPARKPLAEAQPQLVELPLVERVSSLKNHVRVLEKERKPKPGSIEYLRQDVADSVAALVEAGYHPVAIVERVEAQATFNIGGTMDAPRVRVSASNAQEDLASLADYLHTLLGSVDTWSSSSGGMSSSDRGSESSRPESEAGGDEARGSSTALIVYQKPTDDYQIVTSGSAKRKAGAHNSPSKAALAAGTKGPDDKLKTPKTRLGFGAANPYDVLGNMSGDESQEFVNSPNSQ